MNKNDQLILYRKMFDEGKITAEQFSAMSGEFEGRKSNQQLVQILLIIFACIFSFIFLTSSIVAVISMKTTGYILSLNNHVYCVLPGKRMSWVYINNFNKKLYYVMPEKFLEKQLNNNTVKRTYKLKDFTFGDEEIDESGNSYVTGTTQDSVSCKIYVNKDMVTSALLTGTVNINNTDESAKYSYYLCSLIYSLGSHPNENQLKTICSPDTYYTNNYDKLILPEHVFNNTKYHIEYYLSSPEKMVITSKLSGSSENNR